MFTVTVVTPMEAPAERVWELLADPERHHLWRRELVHMERLEGNAGEVGARYREALQVGPRTVTSTFVVTTLEPLRLFEFSVTEPAWISSDNTVRLTAGGDTTLVRFESRNHTRGLAGLLDPALRWLFVRSMRRELANLARVAAGMEAG